MSDKQGDSFCTCKSAFLNTLKWFNFYVMKWAILSCLVTVLCIFMVACCNIALQMILVIEKSYEENENRSAQRCLLYLALPSTILLWVVFAGFVLSRQAELIYVAYHIPYYSKDALEIATGLHDNKNMHMHLINLTSSLDHSLSKRNNQEYELGIFVWSGFLMFILSLVMSILNFFDCAIFFMLLGALFIFIGCSIHNETQTSRLYKLVAPVYCFMLLLAALLQFHHTPDWNSPAYTKLVISFVGTSLVFCGLHLLIELWFHPLCFFYNIAKNEVLYLWGYTPYAPYGASICIFVSFLLFYNGSQDYVSIDFALRIMFLVILIVVFGLGVVNTLLFEDIKFDKDVNAFRQMAIVMNTLVIIALFFGMNTAALWKDWGWFFSFSLPGYILNVISFYRFGLVQESEKNVSSDKQKNFFLVGMFVVGTGCVLSLIFSGAKALLFVTMSCHGSFLLLYHLTERDNKMELSVLSFKIAAFSGMTSHRHRLYAGFVCLCFLVVLILLFFAAWSQQDSMYRNHTPGSQYVNDIDKQAGKETYPICAGDFHSLDVIDLAYLTELTYLKDPGTGDSCGETGDMVELQMCIDKYFTVNYTKQFAGSDDYLPYNWVLDYLSYNDTTDLSQNVVYYGAYSNTADLFVIGVRGSTTGRDWLENVNLYSEIVLLQGFSFFVPVVYIWPFEATAIFVKVMSYTESLSIVIKKSLQ